MANEIVVALIAAGSALFGSAITGLFSYLSLRRKTQVSRMREALVQANKDIVAFYHLEELYCEALVNEDQKTVDGIKRSFRKKLREEKGKDSPSAAATAKQAEQRIQRLM